MRILHVINPLLPGGAERMAVDLAEGMKQAGHQVTVLALQATDTFLWKELEKQGVEVRALSQHLSNYSPLHAWRLRRELEGYDVVHVHLFPAQYWAPAPNGFPAIGGCL